MRIGVLNNLRAGRNSATVGKTLDFLRDYPHVFHAETNSAQAVPDALSELARQKIDLLVTNGGDGTLQFALTEVLSSGEFEKIPMVAPLRGGRTNMTAMDLGADRNPVRGLGRVLRAVQEGRLEERVVDRPVLRVASTKGRPVQYGMFFGAGMIHRAMALTHRLFPAKRPGALGAGLVTAGLVAKTAFSPKDGVLTPDKVQVLLDGEMVPHGEFYLVIATSLDRLFWRMNPFWGPEQAPVRLSCVSTSARRFLAAAPGILRGRPRSFVGPTTGYTSRNVHQSDMRLDCGWTVDGEIFEPQPDEFISLTADHRIKFVRA